MAGQNEEAIAALGKLLESGDPRVVLETAATLIAIGEKAKPFFPKMREILAKTNDKGQYPLYTRWAMYYTVERTDPMDSGYGF